MVPRERIWATTPWRATSSSWTTKASGNGSCSSSPRRTGEEFFELRFLTAKDKAAADEVKSILRGLVFGPAEQP